MSAQTKEEWREFFTKNYPLGAQLTVVLTSEAAIYTDDSPQFLILPVQVQEVSEEGVRLRFWTLGDRRELPYWMDHLEDRPWGHALFPTREPYQRLLLSNKLTEEQREALSAAT